MDLTDEEIINIERVATILSKKTSPHDPYSSWSIYDLQMETQLTPDQIDFILSYLTNEINIIDCTPSIGLNKNYKAKSNIKLFIEKGGIKKLLEDKKNKIIKEKELHDATIKASNATVEASKSAKSSKNWGIITSCVGIISLIWAIYQSIITNELSKEVTNMEKKIDSLIEYNQNNRAKSNNNMIPK